MAPEPQPAAIEDYLSENRTFAPPGKTISVAVAPLARWDHSPLRPEDEQ